jgi:hypothetical protein
MYVIMYVIFRSIIAASAIIRYYAIYHEPPSWSRNNQVVESRRLFIRKQLLQYVRLQ